MSILSSKTEILCTYEKPIETLKAVSSKFKYLTAYVVLRSYHALSQLTIVDVEIQT